MSEESDAELTTAIAPELFNVGSRLRALREERGLSQRELARRAGMTNANLSMIEQERVSPSIATLEKILRALPIELGEFFSPSLPTNSVVARSADFASIRRGGSVYRVLHPVPGSDAPYIALQTLAPKATLSGTWLDRPGWISGVVQSGELTLTVEKRQFIIPIGDGFQFHSKRDHQFANLGDFPLQITLVVNSQGSGRDRKV